MDGSPQIGLGHLVRCMALAQMLKKYFDISFYLLESIPSQINTVVAPNFNLITIKSESMFLDSLTGKEIVILDGYHFDTSYQRKVKESGSLLICIDDIHDKHFIADIVINNSPCIHKENYSAEPYTSFLLGPDYALLRNGFLINARSQRAIKTIENVLICFGGSDYYNYTITVLKSVGRFFSQFNKVRIITGSGYAHLDTLRDFIENDGKIEHYHNINEEQMIFLMSETQLAIVPASGVLLETLAMKCIPITGYYVTNQIDFYNGFLKRKAIIGVDNFSSEKLESALMDVLFMHKRPFNTNIIDGNSGDRIQKEFVTLYLLKHLQLRLAKVEDSKQYFKWANESDVRANSKNSGYIEWEAHDQWFLKKLRSNDSQLYFFYMEDQAVGQVRFDLEDGNWLIDFSLDERFRGFGFGKVIVHKAILELKKKSDLSLVAFVKETNVSSLKVFSGLGFAQVKTFNGYRYYVLD